MFAKLFNFDGQVVKVTQQFDYQYTKLFVITFVDR